MSYKITAVSFAKNFDQGANTLKRALNNYIDDPSVDNIHDIRTATRKLQASFRLLPKKMRKKNPIREFMEQSKKLFKINTETRDLDIIQGRLEKYASHRGYKDLVMMMRSKRNNRVKEAKKVAVILDKVKIPSIRAQDIQQAKLQARFDKSVRRLSDKIEKILPVVADDESKVKELHTLRKDCKKLRYFLELSAEDKQITSRVSKLKEWQSLLGMICDIDITIEYLNYVKSALPFKDVIQHEVGERKREFTLFVNASKSDKQLVLAK
jgi:CHAD domain-containing protein